MNKVLVIGPFPKPTTGVSLANKVLFEFLSVRKNFKVDYINTSYNKFQENLGAFSIDKVIFYLKLNFSIFKVFKTDILYITPGQTFFGVLKYSLFILLASLLRKEIIIHVHGNHLGKEYSLLKGLKKRVFKYLLSKSSKGIVLSESLKGNMSPFIANDKIFVIYNFVEDYLFDDEETNKAIKQPIQKPKIVFLSNLMEEKGIFELLEALKTLEEEGFEYEAKIAGNIDAKFENRIYEYFNILKNTEYCGVVSGLDKKELLLWSNIFTLATYYTMEGQPISILEAMATGNLILTTNHAGIPDVFCDSINGFYVDKKSAESIVDKIKSISSNKEHWAKIREENYATAKQKYRVKNFIDNIAQVFEA